MFRVWGYPKHWDSAGFYSNVSESYSWSGYTGSNLDNIWLQREILLLLQVLKPPHVARVSTKEQKISRKTIISRIFSCRNGNAEEDVDQKVNYYFKLEFHMFGVICLLSVTAPHLNFGITCVRSFQFEREILCRRSFLSQAKIFFSFHVAVLPEEG